MSKRKVLIVGGGIAGLSLANALEQFCQTSVDYKIIERQREFAPQGAGIALPANAVSALDQLNLFEKVRKNAFHVQQIVFVDENMNELSAKPTDPLHPKKFPFLGITRAKLHHVLVTPAIENKIHMGITLLGLKEVNDKIEVTFSDNTTELFDLVIGADGIRSHVRKLSHLEVDEPPLSLGITHWRFLIKKQATLLHPTYVLGTGCLFLLFPVSNEEAYCYACVLTPPKGISEDERKSVHFMKSHFEHMGKEVKFALDQIIDPHQLIPDQLETVREVKTHSHQMKHVLFIGDAAHACAPTYQQGGAMSIEDGVIVAKLLNAFHAFSTEQIIKFYDSFRFKTMQEIQTLSNFVQQRAVQAVDPQSIEARNQKIRQDGPFNVTFWKEYFKTDVFDELDNFIRTRLH